MKVGMRKPSIKRSIKARTTGKIKRKLKSSINPLYNKKGMGLVNDPSKAIYNKVYHKTTFGVRDVINACSDTNKNNSTNNISSNKDYSITEDGKYIILNNKKTNIKVKSLSTYIKTFYILGLMCLLIGIPLFFVGGFICVIFSFISFGVAKKYKDIKNDLDKTKELE